MPQLQRLSTLDEFTVQSNAVDYESTFRRIGLGHVVKGMVTSISPKEVVDRLMSERKANANTHKNYKARLEPKRSAGDAYTTESYRRVIHRACESQKIEQWGPHRLRHAAGTAVRAMFGLEAAQVVLGHSNAKTSEIYAEKNFGSATEIMKRIG